MHDSSNNPITLVTTTGSVLIDILLCTLIDRCEQQFPNRIRGYYVEGSYADGTAVPASDLDLRIIFKNQLRQDEREQFTILVTQWAALSSIALDLKAESEGDLLRIGALRFQRATLLVYGVDIRDQIPLKPLASYIRDTLHGLYPIFARLRGLPPVLIYPLDHPDPTGYLYGYDRRRARLPDGSIHPSIKDLAVQVLSTATARIAAEAQQYVVTKRDCVPLYRTYIHDQWLPLVEDIDAVCRKQWGYLVPKTPEQHQQLRDLCQQGLAFQNDFLQRYKDYLLGELQHEDPSIRRFAAQRFGQLVYRDPRVVTALQERAVHDTQDVRQAAATSLRQYS